ncbi:MAG: hypothetical protein Q4F38_01380 [Akkermansia sp.]|nr:hypothetical protein [Akkermansia sp.]
MTESALQVMFMGNFAHKLDPKYRVAVPARWRSVYGQELVMLESTYHGYNILKCFTHESFATKLNEIRERALADGYELGDVDEYIGDIAGKSFVGEVNSQGKLLIPKQQRDLLKLDEYASFVGRTAHFEIWNKEDFEADTAPKTNKENPLNKKFRML